MDAEVNNIKQLKIYLKIKKRLLIIKLTLSFINLITFKYWNKINQIK